MEAVWMLVHAGCCNEKTWIDGELPTLPWLDAMIKVFWHLQGRGKYSCVAAVAGLPKSLCSHSQVEVLCYPSRHV